ncbi:EAL domain-containing protein [Lysobacter ciconiae]|uniref:cyclic-guanylate-specific phosphodiesterase n=2 Tax=Novilysobacter ciconiae TaxID=2781022 RepID=A0A7S6ZT49_9GAMM|nr:EAL domain-containing protein [Lysobacter ciconiae]
MQMGLLLGVLLIMTAPCTRAGAPGGPDPSLPFSSDAPGMASTARNDLHAQPAASSTRTQSVARSSQTTVIPTPAPGLAAGLWRSPLGLSVIALLVLITGVALVGYVRLRGRETRLWANRIRERDERLMLALWASGEEFWDYDLSAEELHHTRVTTNPQDEPELKVERYRLDELTIHGDDLAQVQEALRQHLRGTTPVFASEYRTRRAEESSWCWVRARGRVVEWGPDGRPLRVAGTVRTVTEKRSAEHERRVATEVLRNMDEAVAVFDRDFQFISVNPAFTRITGHEPDDVLDRSTSVLDSSRQDIEYHRRLRHDLLRDGRWSGELWMRRRNGDEFLCLLRISSVGERDGRRSHYIAVLSDITEKKRAEQELRYLANYDPLTGLPNRTLLLERIAAAIVRARAAQSRIGVLFIDLDRFKDINDSLGHGVGDLILRAVATRLHAFAGPHQTAARLSGDEFMLVLENVETDAQISDATQRLIAAFEAPVTYGDRQEAIISPSIGVSVYPDDARIASELIRHADTAMYRAKAVGRRTSMRYDAAMDLDVQRRATLSAALRTVLDRNELSMVYQPRLSLNGGHIAGVEALLRWHSPEHGQIHPTQFIPLTEENGMILEIGQWALREACRALATWRSAGLMDIPIAVNVSSLQLLRGDFPQVVERVLAQTGIPANRLELELTESVLMDNPAESSVSLQQFRRLGVNLAIDDFGTGYSSLSYLKRLPITMLKIDKEFIDDLPRDTDDAAITTTIIAMGHSLGLTVVAEGVETASQAQWLRDHRCDEIQGYWLAEPMPAESIAQFVQARSWAETTAS